MLSFRGASSCSGSFEKDPLHDVERELVEQVCFWTRRVLVIGPAAGVFFGYIGGEDPSQLLNPALLSLFGVLSSFIAPSILDQMVMLMSVGIILILRHSLNQGCSACLVPAIYGFLPCASGFVFRTSRAVAVSTVGVLAATCVLYAVDLSGNCTSEPIDPDDRGTKIADRLVPLLMLIIGNGSVLTIIVRQSQESMLLHARAAESASNLAEMRRDVLHRVTHELRTPLNAMVGSVELLTASDTMPEMDMENALTIKRCLSTILSICDNVLMAAKSDQGNEETPFLLATCIDGIAEFFTASVEAKGVKLQVEYDGDTTVVVHGMEIKLRQVLLNLVGNSLKFTESGSITVRVQTQDDLVSPDKIHCRFEVQDTGIGIEQESSDMLFEAFHQEEQGAVSRRHKGTGLGLAICRDFVLLMGGEIAVDGKRGEGSRFYFSLTLKKESPSVSEEDPNKRNSSDRSACRALIADPATSSSLSCRSVVKSVVPESTSVDSVRSSKELHDLLDNEQQNIGMDDGIRRLAFLSSDMVGLESLPAILFRMKQSGWIVFVHCDNADFPTVTGQSGNAYAVVRRPLKVSSLTESFRAALRGNSAGPSGGSEKLDESDTEEELLPSSHAPAANSSPSITPLFENPGISVEAEAAGPLESGPKVVTPLFENPGISVEAEAAGPLESGPKVVIVDDTAINVKVMSKMLSRSTSLPIIPLYDGQSAIELVERSHRTDVLLFLMDWHMPLTCGITATESIRKIARERGGPQVFICIITADLEGLQQEMENRHLSYNGIVTGGTLSRTSGGGRSETSPDFPVLLSSEGQTDEYAVLDIVAGKPVTFKSIQAILTWFQEQSHSGVASLDAFNSLGPE